MQLFSIQILATSLLAGIGLADDKWRIDEEYYRYRGPPAPLSSDGRVIDTPEVAHAKAAHLATHAEIIASVRHESRPDVWHEPSGNAVNTYELKSHEMDQIIYHGPLAPLGQDGRVVDTTEVAQAKAAHLAAHADAAKDASPDWDYRESPNGIWDDRGIQQIYAFDHPPGHVTHVHHHLPTLYRGPPAPLAPDGRVLDTPEVAKAKEAHLRAHAHAVALTAHGEPELRYPL